MFIDGGTGSTMYPANITNLAARTAAVNPNISAYLRNVSMYNRPMSMPVPGMPSTANPDLYTYISMSAMNQISPGTADAKASINKLWTQTPIGGPTVNYPSSSTTPTQTQANTDPKLGMTSNGMPLASTADGSWVAGDSASAHETDGMSAPSSSIPDSNPDSIRGKIRIAQQNWLSTISEQQAKMYIDTSRTDEITGEKLWAMPEIPYLGVTPGYVPTQLPKEPAQDASDEELTRYLNQLNSGVQVTMYRANDPLEFLGKMDEPTLRQFKKNLLYLGSYPEGTSLSIKDPNNTDIEIMTSLMSQANIAGTTWEQQMKNAIDGKAIYDAKVAAAGGGGGGGGGTNTQITYNQTSIAQARALLISVLTDAIGRYPTQDEVVKFLKILNSAESKSPVTTVSTSSGDATTTRVSQTSVDPERLAQQFAEDIGGGAPAQANSADRYMAALAGSLGGVNG
jgi:hypothetical protein